MIGPWFLLARRRLIACFAVSLFFAFAIHMWVSAESLTDVGIFWHHFCGCPVDPDDVRVILNFPITASLVGFFLGASFNTASPRGWSSTRFLLTRPISRATVLFAPLTLATAAIAVMPALAFLLLVGWLRLVHAPSLHHFLATLQQLPAVAALGPHPRFFDLLSAIDFPRRYLASIALGLCFYTVMASQRWLLLSPNSKLRILGVFPAFLVAFPIFRVLGKAIANAIFMTPGRGTPLGYAPSTLSIALHFAFVAAIICGCLRLVYTVET